MCMVYLICDTIINYYLLTYLLVFLGYTTISIIRPPPFQPYTIVSYLHIQDLNISQIHKTGLLISKANNLKYSAFEKFYNL